MATFFWTTIGAILTLSIYSFLYKDNPFFRFAESVFAGVSLGYYIGQTFDQTIMPNVITPLIDESPAPFISARSSSSRSAVSRASIRLAS
mgnify:CR=1 FL=1